VTFTDIPEMIYLLEQNVRNNLSSEYNPLVKAHTWYGVIIVCASYPTNCLIKGVMMFHHFVHHLTTLLERMSFLKFKWSSH
jgi:hypothetical protein